MDKQGTQNPAGCKPLTTFVQTDTNGFREVVQRLTGPSESDPPVQGTTATNVASMKRSTSKLHERRQYARPKLVIVKPPVSFKPLTSPRNASRHPSPVGTPSTILSKLSIEEQESKDTAIKCEEEEKAIRERRFYLHPSPRSKAGDAKPELLTLFPLTSQKES